MPKSTSIHRFKPTADSMPFIAEFSRIYLRSVIPGYQYFSSNQMDNFESQLTKLIMLHCFIDKHLLTQKELRASLEDINEYLALLNKPIPEKSITFTERVKFVKNHLPSHLNEQRALFNLLQTIFFSLMREQEQSFIDKLDSNCEYDPDNGKVLFKPFFMSKSLYQPSYKLSINDLKNIASNSNNKYIMHFFEYVHLSRFLAQESHPNIDHKSRGLLIFTYHLKHQANHLSHNSLIGPFYKEMKKFFTIIDSSASVNNSRVRETSSSESSLLSFRT